MSSESIEPSLAGRVDTSEYSKIAKMLVDSENDIPVTIGVDTSVRPKVIDRCGLSCTFCHNEGTPVAQARKSLTLFDERYKGGRVSIFENSNGVNFLPGVMLPDEQFESALNSLKEELGATELHLTGGEPTLHPKIAEIIGVAVKAGYQVGMTSNGENGKRALPPSRDAGLSKVNFSIFGTTPEELAAVQNERYKSTTLASSKMESLKESINTALEGGLQVSANIVMTDTTHEERVRRIVGQYANAGVSIRILMDLDGAGQSARSIYEMLARMKAVPKELHVEAGSSNARVRYTLPNGVDMFFKQIRRTTLPEACNNCHFNNSDDCKEGFYGTRLYVDQSNNYKVGLCLQRMDLTLPIEEFVARGLGRKIVDFREKEYLALTDYYKDRLAND